MKVAFKLIFCLVIGTIILVAIDAAVSIRRETKLFQSEMHHDAHMLGSAFQTFVTKVWDSDGQASALAMIDDANKHEQRIRVRWVWLTSAPDDERRPHVDESLILQQLGTKSQVSFLAVNEKGGQTLYTYVPISVRAAPQAAIELAEPMSHLDAYTRRTIMQTLAFSLGLIISAAVVASVLGIHFIGKPLNQLMVKLQRIGRGDLSPTKAKRRRDEFGDLATTLDKMCEDLEATRLQLESEMAERIKTVEELRHADRLRTVGRLSAGVAHELGTPLNVVAEHARIIQEACNDQRSEIGRSARIIEHESDQMVSIVRQLLDFSRREPAEQEMTDLTRLAEDTVEMLRPLAEERQLRLYLEPTQDHVESVVFRRQIQQVLINLIDNAFDASPAGGEVRLQVTRERICSPRKPDGVPGDHARLNVHDDGDGSLAEDIERIFEPFFTTKDVGEGTGLGLSIAYSIVEEHGGWIEVSTGQDQGTCFSVYFPVCFMRDAPNDLKKGNVAPTPR